MFTRFFTWMQLRHSTAFLLTRADDRLLDDIGLTRADLERLHLDPTASALPRLSGNLARTLPVAG
ncbi:DUF1127 domain-containing protein [Xinfangfangia pollutisoli]|uniref:DUF1127 domain-containing protein n=1 Tax=Xinfangfangia pollutisoli TaxID=2865960 RepID=UPI001CD5FC7E|nr:DUF1127 domain-containing protein [Xinfangfangia pollutisoli]